MKPVIISIAVLTGTFIMKIFHQKDHLTRSCLYLFYFRFSTNQTKNVFAVNVFGL